MYAEEAAVLERIEPARVGHMPEYVGEVRALAAGVPVHWATWEELLPLDEGMRLFGKGFHNSAVQMTPGRFLPLVLIASCLFERTQDKRVQFSAGMEIGSRPPVPDDEPVSLTPQLLLVPNFPAGYGRLRAFRRADDLDPDWLDWLAQDPLDRLCRDTQTLLRRGRMVWDSLVHLRRHQKLFSLRGWQLGHPEL